jgi:hypothetical protein
VAIVIPLVCVLAVSAGLLWRWRAAKDRRTDGHLAGTSSTGATPDASRDASRETSRSGKYQAPQLQLHGVAAGDLEAEQAPTSPLDATLAEQAAAAALAKRQQQQHVRRRSSHVKVNIDDMAALDGDAVMSRTGTQAPRFHDRDYLNPLSPAQAQLASGIAASIGAGSATGAGGSPSAPLGSPSLAGGGAGERSHEFASYPESSSLFQQQQAHFVEDKKAPPAIAAMYSLRSVQQQVSPTPPPMPARPPPLPSAAAAGGAPTSPSPTSPPMRAGYASVARMSPPPLPPGAGMASPSPSPSPEPQAPFLRRAPQ